MPYEEIGPTDVVDELKDDENAIIALNKLAFNYVYRLYASSYRRLPGPSSPTHASKTAYQYYVAETER